MSSVLLISQRPTIQAGRLRYGENMKITEKKLYLKNGYLNIDYILDLGFTFTAIVGGRGTGKTFGILKYLKERKLKFLYVRRTKTQRELIDLDTNNNFMKLNEMYGWNVHPIKTSKNGAEYFECETLEDGSYEHGPDSIGRTEALSTIYNLRGVADDSSFKFIFYDEFIPLKGERPIKAEFDAFSQMYETYNRNRELEGKDPIRLVMAANANLIDNPIFTGLGIVNKILKRQQKAGSDSFMIFPEKSLLIIFAKDSPISAAKKQTALAKLLGDRMDSAYLDNEFDVDDERFIKSIPLVELAPVAKLGELVIYKHKSRRGLYYVTPHESGSFPVFPASDAARFFRKYFNIYDAFTSYNIQYSDYLTKSLFTSYIRK